MKRWWLLIALLLSVGVNLGILAALAVDRLRPEPPPVTAPGPGSGPDFAVLADRLGVEGRQRERFVEIQERLFRDGRAHRQRVERLRGELRRELLSPRTERRRVDEILRQLEPLYGEMDRLLAGAILDSREVLTPEQQRLYLRFLASRLGPLRERPRPQPLRPRRPLRGPGR